MMQATWRPTDRGPELTTFSAEINLTGKNGLEFTRMNPQETSLQGQPGMIKKTLVYQDLTRSHEALPWPEREREQ